MKIAVTYENGEVFQHFGRTENFKLYEVEDGKILSSEILSSGGTGHEALAYLLADKSVNLLICGGMGEALRRPSRTRASWSAPARPETRTKPWRLICAAN